MTSDPVALALLRRLAELRPAGDPLHVFARGVLSGELSMRSAAGRGIFDEALGAAFESARAPLDAALRSSVDLPPAGPP